MRAGLGTKNHPRRRDDAELAGGRCGRTCRRPVAAMRLSSCARDDRRRTPRGEQPLGDSLTRPDPCSSIHQGDSRRRDRPSSPPAPDSRAASGRVGERQLGLWAGGRDLRGSSGCRGGAKARDRPRHRQSAGTHWPAGAYAELVAAHGCMALARHQPTLRASGAPFGGIDGRLSTNPIAFAVPNGETPVVADFSTSQLPEGRVRSARNRGERLPEGVLQDAAGNPTVDPGALYDRPRGTLCPSAGRLRPQGLRPGDSRRGDGDASPAMRSMTLRGPAST
jgi:hypothetical protein